MENKRRRNVYDRDFKVSAMKLILEKHQSVPKVSRDLGVSQNTLHLWKRSKILMKRTGVFMGAPELPEY